MNEESGSTFLGPTWPARVFTDEAGHVIEYGNRWHGGPPDWAYGATSNLERFTPLHKVAEALIGYLIRDYRVVADEAHDGAPTLDPAPPDFIRLVRLDPDGSGGTSMTIVFTSFPGVMVYSGTRFHEGFPACGCDACDDAADHVADCLEDRVLALANEELGWSRRS